MSHTMRPYPQYRPSGISWLGDIPAHWEVKRLKQVLSRNDGGVWGEDPKISPDGNEIGTLVLRSTEQTAAGDWIMENPAYRSLTFDEAFNFRLIEGDLVITKSSGSELHIGKTSLVTKEIEDLGCCYSNFMQRLRVTKKSNPRFVRYIINGNIGRAQFVYLSKSTSGLANLNSEIIDNVYIPLPSPKEQQAIAAYLDRETRKIDELISRKERFILLLAEKRSALISHAVTRGLNPDAPTKESGVEWLGEIPAHWNYLPIKYVVEFMNGAPFKPEEWTSEGTPIIRIENLNGSEEYNYTQRVIDDKYRVSKGEIVFGWSGNRGTSFGPFIWNNEGEFYLNQHIFLLKNYDCDRKWLYWLLRAMTLYIESRAHGIIGMVHITKKELGIIPIVVPLLEEQKKISAFLDMETSKIDRLTEKTRQHITRLQERRSALISAAVTGKIDVRSSEKVPR